MSHIQKQKISVINKFKLHDNDCGSSSVQIISLSYDINILTEHLKSFKKDNHSKRGLIKKVSTRKRLLNYLKKKNNNTYNSIIKYLNIRK